MARIVRWHEQIDQDDTWALIAVVDDGLGPHSPLRTVGGYIHNWSRVPPELQARVAAKVRQRAEAQIVNGAPRKLARCRSVPKATA